MKLRDLSRSALTLCGVASLLIGSPLFAIDAENGPTLFELNLPDFADLLSQSLDHELFFNQEELDADLVVHCQTPCTAGEFVQVLRQSLAFEGFEIVDGVVAGKQFICPQLFKERPDLEEPWCTFVVRNTEQFPIPLDRLSMTFSDDAVVTAPGNGLIIATGRESEILSTKARLDDIRRFNSLGIDSHNTLTELSQWGHADETGSICLVVSAAALGDLSEWLEDKDPADVGHALARWQPAEMTGGERSQTIERHFVELGHTSGEETASFLRHCWPWLCEGQSNEPVDSLYWFGSNRVLVLTGTSDECKRMEQVMRLYDRPESDKQCMVVFRRQTDVEGVFYQAFDEESHGGIIYLDERRFDLLFHMIFSKVGTHTTAVDVGSVNEDSRQLTYMMRQGKAPANPHRVR